jgi:hypothetical protein
LLRYFDLISTDTLVVGWIGKALLLVAAFVMWGLWSLVVWIRDTPSGEHGPAFLRSLKKLPSALAWLTIGALICFGVDALEKRYGVPFYVSGGVLLIAFLAVNWLLDNRRGTGAKS